MNVNECITSRRSIRKYKPDPVDHSLIESIVSMASYSPSWKNTQITRYIAIDDSSILKKIADDCTPVYNSNIIQQSPMLIAVTFIKGRCGFERDGSYSTKKEDRWQMFDVGAACQTFCLAANLQHSLLLVGLILTRKLQKERAWMIYYSSDKIYIFTFL